MPPAVALQHILPERLDDIWPVVVRLLGWQNMKGEVTLPALRNRLLIGYSDLWTAPDWRFPSRLSGVIVTTIIQRPRREPCLRIEFLSGRRIGTWIESTACTLGQYAQAHGCTHLEMIGRLGWRHYRSHFGLPGAWLTEERAADRCRPLSNKD
jgi:hypothetical protein